MKDYFTLIVFIHYSALVHYELWHGIAIRDRGGGYWLPETYGLKDINFDFPLSEQVKHMAFTASLNDLARKEAFLDGNGDNIDSEVGLYNLLTDNFCYVYESADTSMKVVQATLYTQAPLPITQIKIYPNILSVFSSLKEIVKNNG